AVAAGAAIVIGKLVRPLEWRGAPALLDARSKARRQSKRREIVSLDVVATGRELVARPPDPDAGQPAMRREDEHLAPGAHVELDAVGRHAVPIGEIAACSRRMIDFHWRVHRA